MDKKLAVFKILKRLFLFSFFCFSLLLVNEYKVKKEEFTNAVFTVKTGSMEILKINHSYSNRNFMRFTGKINNYEDSLEYAVELKNIILPNSTRIKYYEEEELIPVWYNSDTKKVQIRVFDDKIKNIEFLENEHTKNSKIEFTILSILGVFSLIFTLIDYFLK